MAGGKKNDYQTYTILICALLFFVIFGVFIFKLINSSSKSFFEGFTSSDLTIEYYSMSTCPHCQAFENTWGEFISIKSDRYTPVKYNLDEKDGSSRANTFEEVINSAPTIVAVKNNNVVDTLKDRSLSSLKAFAAKNSN